MRKPVAYCTQWRGDCKSKRGRFVSIPLCREEIDGVELIFSKRTSAGQLVEIERGAAGDLSIFIDGEYQLGVAYDGVEPFYGDEAHRAYLNVLQLNGASLADSRVLIIGGGDLGLACLLLDQGSSRITQFELDEEVVQILSKYLPFTKEGLADDRIKISYGDGFEKLKACEKNSFDIIIGDLTREGTLPFGDTLVHEELKRVCSSSGFIVTHYGEGGLDLNSVFAGFYSENCPSFFCVTESSPDARVVWSPRPIRGVDYKEKIS